MLKMFGRIVSDWVFLEEEMIEVINLLVFVDYDIRRQASEKTREFMGNVPSCVEIRSAGVSV